MRRVVYAVVFAVVVFVGGLLVLALLAVRLYRKVKSLGGTVGAAATRIGDATAEVETFAARER